MNIQKFILPHWKEAVRQSELPSLTQSVYINKGKSMAEFLDRKMMRKLPDSWFDGWVRYHFPLTVDPKVVNLHKVIADSFVGFIENYRDQSSGFDISKVYEEEFQSLEQTIHDQREQRQERLSQLMEEINGIRKKHQKSTNGKPSRKQKNISKMVKPKSEPEIPAQKMVDHEFVYQEWMKKVNEKPISKSYWHIHEYMSRYIMDFAKKHNPETGEVTEEIVEDFLKEYGKGKRPKTMNHYNRVARYFWEFFDQLVNKQ